MLTVNINGRSVTLTPKQAIGHGGEADVFDLGGTHCVKIFKAPDHPDIAGDAALEQAARLRLAEHQHKLPAFPRGFPLRVIVPEELARDTKSRKILGYVMRRVPHAEVLLSYGQRAFRQAVAANNIIPVLADLHETVDGVHRAGAVIGDFNDLNVLVSGTEAYLIDADSFQFPPFACHMFTAKFVDPLICDTHAAFLKMIGTHSAATDWYAYAVMVMQTLLFAGPYDGVYLPKDAAKRITHDLRSLHRITVFHPEVRYPKPAIPFAALPDDLLQRLHLIFEKDERGVFPKALLLNLRWTTCTACGTEHARNVCPVCAKTAPDLVKTKITVRGNVTCERVFRTTGTLLLVTHQDNVLRWIAHEHDQFLREDGSTVLSGPMDPDMRLRIRGNATLIGKGSHAYVMEPGAAPEPLAVDQYHGIPTFDANAHHVYWLDHGVLQRDEIVLNTLTPHRIGDTLEDQTLFWVGPRFGFGLSRANQALIAFVFDAEHRGLNDGIKIPPIRGHLIGATCAFSDDRCWFFTTVQENGKTVNRCLVLTPAGSIIAEGEATAGDGSWLGSIRGRLAIGHALYAPTDNGIVRVEIANNKPFVAKEFPDTEPFVDDDCSLFPGPGGLLVADRKEIRLLRIK